MRYTLFRKQQLNCSIETAWDFFSNPMNLATITPKDLGFTILNKEDKLDKIYSGMIINYKVSPLLGVPLHWQTRIDQVNMYHSFVDFQEKGPYKYWKHHHEFLINDDGVLMKDNIEYELPFGIIGDITNTLIVRQKLINIFDYRYNILEEMFNTIVN